MVYDFCKRSIKQKIQERDFRAWDSTDIDFQDQTNLPSIIKEAAKDKKFFVIESEKYWCLIGIADKPRQNPYSVKRFLHEETGSNEMFVYLTHIIIRKNLLAEQRYIEHVNYCMSRLYTLDAGVSDTIIKFIAETQHLCKTRLQPLLKREIKKDGEDTEYHINKRMNEYEQQITVSVLNKLNNIIKNVIDDSNDRDYLFYYLNKIFDKLIDSVQNFQLRPVATYSFSVETMIARLISFKQFLDMIYKSLEDDHFDIKELADVSKEIIATIKEELDEVENNLEQVKRLEERLKTYYQIRENGNFWQKLIVGRLPKYSLEDMKNSKDKVKNEFFLSIVRLAKIQSENIVYLEFDCNEILNEHYRHYAIADDKLMVARLPKILRLPEDKKTFDVERVNEAIHHNVFIVNKNFAV